jgi:Transglutaminase-like superfamily
LSLNAVENGLGYAGRAMDDAIPDAPPRMTMTDKVRLGGRVWSAYFRARRGIRRLPLPELVEHLGLPRAAPGIRVAPKRLGQIVGRSLRLGPLRPRCLYTALVLYQLLREQGDEAQLVIGLPREPKHKDAHAWVEVAGMDVGPPPGRRAHEPLARFS